MLLMMGLEEQISEQMGLFDFTDIDRALSGSGVSFPGLMERAVRGELDLTPWTLIGAAFNSFLGETASLFSVMGTLTVIVLLGAVLRVLSSSFTRKSVSEAGFFITYLISVALIMSSFFLCIDIMRDVTGLLGGIMEAALPLMVAAAVMAGNGVKAYAVNPVILFALTFITEFIKNVAAPAIVSAALLQTASCMTERDMLLKLTEFIKKAISWALRIICVFFTAVLSLQSLTAPIISSIAVKSAKYAVNAVPVVGSAMSGAVDTVLIAAGTLKNGMVAAAVIALVTACAVPLIKTASFLFVYKLTAAILQPAGDERIVNLIDLTGGLAGLALSACTVTAVMFIFMAVILLA